MFNPKITKGEWINKNSMIKSSKGEWFIVKHSYNCIIKSSDDEVIADVIYTPDENETYSHNAKAIAAVPELLEVYRAIKEFSDYHAGNRDFNFTYGESFNPVLAAIKKLEVS
ncbi:MAG TPA: hypothetical protein DEG69_05740 [Flavobacteriaceae bacterium]|nr:hypothetical protein [Flavobacteriaceae bacterium]|tara:strand:- start:538 stop:873 length:336 start_codon:yes stop_codon:yes gene_type:complete